MKKHELLRMWYKTDTFKIFAWGSALGLASYRVSDFFEPPSYYTKRLKAPIAPPAKLSARVHKLATDIGLTDPNRVHVFMYKGTTGISSGTTAIPQAYGLLGIPYTALASSPLDPILKGVKLRVPTSVRDNVAGIEDQVRALMFWDEDMLNFTVAHELAHIHNSDTVWHGMKDPAFIVGGFYAYNATVRSMSWVVPRAAFITVLLPALYYGLNMATNWRHEFRADKVAAAQGFAAGGVERLKRKEQIDGLKAQVLALRSATLPDAQIKFRKEEKGGEKSPGFLHNVYALSTHPPSDWRTEALQKKMTGMRSAIYSILTLGS